MSIFSEIRRAFPELTLTDISDYYSNEIDLAKQVYQGKPPWNSVKSSGIKKKHRERSLMNMAKVVCDKLAALTFSEQCDIVCSDDKYNEIIHKVLDDNAFWEKMPEWLSRAFALGGGIIKLNIINGDITLDYLNADVFLPTKWNNRHILEGIFKSVYVKGGKYYSIFERRYFGDNELSIDNVVIESDSSSCNGGSNVSIEIVFPGMPDKSSYNGAKTPFFVYFKPAIGNNKNFDIPLGLPIFANCYDTLEELDIVFDSLQREFILGKKRIIIPEEMIQNVYDSEGNPTRYFDADDEVYQAMAGSSGDKMNIVDNSVNLRVQEHCDALHNLLDILSMQIGLSSGSLSYDKSDGVKTATEVVANQHETMRTVENQKNIVTECIKELCEDIIAAYCSINYEPIRKNDITVSWQDNVIGDDESGISKNVELVNAGLRSKKHALIDINRYSEADAEKELREISNDSVSSGAIDNLFGGDNE